MTALQHTLLQQADHDYVERNDEATAAHRWSAERISRLHDAGDPRLSSIIAIEMFGLSSEELSAAGLPVESDL